MGWILIKAEILSHAEEKHDRTGIEKPNSVSEAGCSTAKGYSGMDATIRKFTGLFLWLLSGEGTGVDLADG